MSPRRELWRSESKIGKLGADLGGMAGAVFRCAFLPVPFSLLSRTVTQC